MNSNSKGAEECERSSSHSHTNTYTDLDTAKHKHLLATTNRNKHSPDFIDTHTVGVTQPIMVAVLPDCDLKRAARDDRRTRDTREILRLCAVHEQSVGRCIDCKGQVEDSIRGSGKTRSCLRSSLPFVEKTCVRAFRQAGTTQHTPEDAPSRRESCLG